MLRVERIDLLLHVREALLEVDFVVIFGVVWESRSSAFVEDGEEIM